MTRRHDTGDPSNPLDQLAQLIGDSLAAAASDGSGFDSTAFADVPAPTHWPSLPSADAAAEWNELGAWVEALQGRFAHLDHHVIPRCWWRHNDHVEALAALRDHEASSFGPAAPATAPLDWFRALRDITALLKAWTADIGCDATHTDPPPRCEPPSAASRASGLGSSPPTSPDEPTPRSTGRPSRRQINSVDRPPVTE